MKYLVVPIWGATGSAGRLQDVCDIFETLAKPVAPSFLNMMMHLLRIGISCKGYPLGDICRVSFLKTGLDRYRDSC